MTEPSAGTELTVASWNIHAGRGLDGAYDLSRIIDVIEACDPDVIGLQEVDRQFRARSSFDDQIEILAEELGMNYRFGGNIQSDEDSDGAYGIATLVDESWPIVESTHSLLPTVPDRASELEQRGLLTTRCAIGDSTFVLLNTHLGLDAEERNRQIESVLEVIRETSDPLVLVGDMNARPESEPIRRLKEQLVDIQPSADDPMGGTHPTDDPEKRIDYLLVSPAIAAGTTKLVASTASDHALIAAELTIPN